MSNPHQKLFEYCKQQKEQAMAIHESTNDSKKRYNASQAINAWDELAGQLYKHKAINKKRFEKTKMTALFCVSLMTTGSFKSKTIQKINDLKL